jgi:two-component system, chemotaxis family, response regulator Rcp1
VSVSTSNTGNESLKSSASAVPPGIQAPALVSLSAGASSTGPRGEAEWNRLPAGVQRFSLRPPLENTSGPSLGAKAASIFLAEDNPADAGLVRKALELHGIEGELVVVPDGEKALEFIEALDATLPTQCPDLAIIDLNLPKKPGRVVLERMRVSERCRHIPVVILSSSNAERDRADAARYGASRYICKPTRLEEFLGLGAIFKSIIATSGS